MVYPAVRIPAKKLPATAAVIFVHGLGDSGNGWKFFADLARQNSSFDQVKFVFPNAPTIPITANGGFPSPGWFDIRAFGQIGKNPDVEGFLKSIQVIKDLIKEQTDAGIPSEKILLGGFSQGAALTLLSSAFLDQKLAGFLVLSGFCPVEELVESKLEKANLETPIFQGHGTNDPIVSYQVARQAYENFTNKLGFKNHAWHEYRGLEHSVAEEELLDIFKFMSKVLL